MTDHDDLDLDAWCPMCGLDLVAGRCPECTPAGTRATQARTSRAERARRLDAAAAGCTVVAFLALTPVVVLAIAGALAWGPWGALAGALTAAALWAAAITTWVRRHGIPMPTSWTDTDPEQHPEQGAPTP